MVEYGALTPTPLAGRVAALSFLAIDAAVRLLVLLISGHNGSAALLSRTLSVMTQGARQGKCSGCSRHQKACSKFVFLPTAVPVLASQHAHATQSLQHCRPMPHYVLFRSAQPHCSVHCSVRNADCCAGDRVQCCSAMPRNAERLSTLAPTSASALVSSASCRRRHRQDLPLWRIRRMTAISPCCQLLPRLSVSCSHCTCQASPSPGWSSSATGAVWPVLASMAVVV